MGADVTSTHLIFFIAATLLAAGVSAVLTTTVLKVSDGITLRGRILSEALSTQIRIVNDPSLVPNNPLLLYVKNVGRTTLDVNLTTILLDGTYHTYTATVLSSSTWAPATVARFTLDLNLSAGDHRVRVSVENGVSDELLFRI